ncbi:MAG: cell division protein FtsZ [Patescibacteria group bacterium]
MPAKKQNSAKKGSVKKTSSSTNTSKGKSLSKKKAPARTKSEKIADKDMMPKIKVIGVGGSGKNAVNYMIKHDVKGVKFVAINTDAQDLDQSKATKKLHIGRNTTAGTGTGMNPEVGKEAALENKEDIIKVLEDSSIVFITGGMGGGTGTGASPIIAQLAKELGILTIAVVTQPFTFEGGKRMALATAGIEELGQYVDAYIVIPNDKILEVADEEATMNDAFSLSDDILLQAVTGISNLITTPGRINIDASDVRTVLEDQGLSLVGIGKAAGENRAEEAAAKAINSPLLDISVRGARSVLFSITAGDDLKMTEVSQIAETITKEIDPEATVKFGTIRDLKLKKGEIRVTVVASGFDAHGRSTESKIKQVIIDEPVDFFKELESAKNQTSYTPLTTPVEVGQPTSTIRGKTTVHPTSSAKKDTKDTQASPKDKEANKAPQAEDDSEDFWSLPAFLKK